MPEPTETEAREERRCRVAAVRDYSVMLDPGSGRARFLLPRELLPEDVEVGDRVDVTARTGRTSEAAAAPGAGTDEPSDAQAGADPDAESAGESDAVSKIFSEAQEALEDIDSGCGRPGLPSGPSRASA